MQNNNANIVDSKIFSELINAKFRGAPLPRGENQPQGDEEEEPDYELLVRQSYVDPDAEYPIPPTVARYEVDNLDFSLFTSGSISLGIGKAKGGKTSFSILLAATIATGRILNPEDDAQGLHSDADGCILVFDTEQGKYYSSLTLTRIKKITGEKYIKRIKYFDLREYDPKVRLGIIQFAVEKAGKVSLIILDGVRDIAYDINDPKEAVVLVTKLMAMSSQYDTHIFSILHQNKGDANARGHLGTELVNKSETVLSINKDAEDDTLSIVEPEYTRGLPFPAFAIRRDDQGTPYLTRHITQASGPGRPKSVRWEDVSQDKHQRILSDVFSDSFAKPKLSELETRLTRYYEAEFGVQLGGRRIKSLLDYLMHDAQLIAKHGKERSPNAYYFLTTHDVTTDA